MRHTNMIHLDPEDGFRLDWDDGRPVLLIEGCRGVPFRVFFRDVDQAQECLGAMGQGLHEPDGSADRRDIVPIPAEAVVDSDDLLESMASSYDVRRAGWEGDATEAELATGRQNCPSEVP